MCDLTLDKLNIGEVGTVLKINTNSSIRRRFFDIGLVPNTLVKCVLKNSNMCAFLIRGAVIAIRNDDLKFISVKRVIK